MNALTKYILRPNRCLVFVCLATNTIAAFMLTAIEDRLFKADEMHNGLKDKGQLYLSRDNGIEGRVITFSVPAKTISSFYSIKTNINKPSVA
jgi:hypothetical protein